MPRQEKQHVQRPCGWDVPDAREMPRAVAGGAGSPAVPGHRGLETGTRVGSLCFKPAAP